jgi:SAM-dependent methyltransferase
MMPDTQQAAYGSRQWAERLFQGAEGDPWGHDWRASQKGRYRKALEMVRAGADPGRVKSVLDIGCALGHFTVMLADYFKDAQVLGVDISPEAVRKCSAAHPGLEFLTAQLPELDLGGRDFDFISALEVIYYVGPENIDRSLARIREALRPGGLLLISSYLNKPPFNTAAVFREAVGKHFTVEREEIRHHNLYTQFENLVRQACDQTTQLNVLASPEGRKRIDAFVRAGVELLGDEDLLERLNDYARERLGDQSISHSILLARRES